MPHVIILMNQKLDAMRGNATTGSIVDLQTAVNAADTYIQQSSGEEEQLHEKLEQVQEFLCDDSTSSAGAAETIEQYTSDINFLLP